MPDEAFDDLLLLKEALAADKREGIPETEAQLARIRLEAEAIRRSWESCNLRKGYMYMADCMTDPRWQRSYGTFGEDPALISEVMEHIIPRIQGSDNGVTDTGVAVTTKHFPGGGPRENGFDPHYAAGQWNVYATPGSLQKYHMPGFVAAVDKKTSSIMPYYSKPSTEKSAGGQGYPVRSLRLRLQPDLRP